MPRPRGPRVRGLVAYRQALLHTQAGWARSATQAAKYLLRWRFTQQLLDDTLTELGHVRQAHDTLAEEVRIYREALADVQQKRIAAEYGMDELAEDLRGIPHNPL